jgi:chemotaxis protein methyltransferase CheR
VRRQVCKRLGRRLRELGLAQISEYRVYLGAHPDEWRALDGLCRISISRFYRDKATFRFLEGEVFPQLARMASTRAQGEVRCWSIGCAAGEEAYTLAILWKLGVAPQFPSMGIRILATDMDPRAIQRAREGHYAAASLKELPEPWLAEACAFSAGGWSVKEDYRRPVMFLQQDIRETAPEGQFHLILCRNLAFTYFGDGPQREVLERIRKRVVPGGALVIGSRESLPEGATDFEPWSQALRVFRKVGAGSLVPC